jgi:hypothetical protein
MGKGICVLLGVPMLALAMVGCSTGLQQVALEDRLAAGYPPAPSPEPKALAVPVKLAVCLQMERRGDVGFQPASRLDWSRHDKAMLVEYLTDSRHLKAVSEFVFLPPETSSDLDELAVAAREQGADAVLVLRGAMDVDRYCNPAVILDLTLIGAMLIPASHRDVMVALRADLFDLRDNRGLVWTGTASETCKINGPTLVVDTRDAADPARKAVLRRTMERFYLYLRRQTPAG